MRVTVGISCYNAEATLADAVRSVFAQTYKDWELLILDDGSTDRSLEVAGSIRDPRVKVISGGENRGLHHRLNQIAGLAESEYLARMDADDIMHPERLTRQVAVLDSDVSPDVVGSAVYVMDYANNPMGIRAEGPLVTSPEKVLSSPILAHATVTGRTEWFRRNPYDASYPRAEDYELWCRTSSTSTFACLGDPLYYIREGARSPRKYLKDYLATTGSVRKALKVYGPPSIGRLRTTRLILNYRMKGEIYRAATLMGAQGLLIRGRNRPLADSELEPAIAGLRRVAQTHVPGLLDLEALV